MPSQEMIRVESVDGIRIDAKPLATELPATPRSRWNGWFIRYFEELLDLTDTLQRRQKAELVYQDLADARIGRQRAISVLRSINKRQKGGWLAK